MLQSAHLRGPSLHYLVDLRQQWKRSEPLYHLRSDQYDLLCPLDSVTRPLSSHHRSLRVDLCRASMARHLQFRLPPDRTLMPSWRRSLSPEPSRSVSSVAISRARTIMLRSFHVSHCRLLTLAILPRYYAILSHQLRIRREPSSLGCITTSITMSQTIGLVPSSLQHLRGRSRVVWYV